MVETKSEIRKKAWELGHFEGYCQGKEDRDAYWRERITKLKNIECFGHGYNRIGGRQEPIPCNACHRCVVLNKLLNQLKNFKR